MQYAVVKENGEDIYKAISSLVNKTNQLCKDGWKPQGGLAIAVTNYGNWRGIQYDVLQAIVKED